MVAADSTRSGSGGGGSSSRRMVARGTSVEDFTEHFASMRRIRGFELQGASSRGYSSQLDSRGSMLYSVAWNADGSLIATGSEDKIVSVGALDLTGKFRQTLVGATHSDSVMKVAWHPTNPSLLASASADRSICVWDMRQKNTKPGRITNKAACTSVAWSPCGQYLVLGDKDERLSLVEGRTFSIGKTCDLSKAVLNEFTYDASGKHLIVALGAGKIGILDMPSLTLSRTLAAHSPQSSCISVALSPSGDRFAVGASDALCSIWNSADLICERMISRLDYMIRCVSFSHDSQLLAVASEDHAVDVAHVDDGASIPFQGGSRADRLRDVLGRVASARAPARTGLSLCYGLPKGLPPEGVRVPERSLRSTAAGRSIDIGDLPFPILYRFNLAL
uniref:WD40 domain-containing protein n=1 Tax=Pristionchus pacificus TaxID=54126 RepID=A0A8R1Z991_PRIPA